MRFLVGFIAGVVVALLLGFLLLLFMSPSMVKSLALDDLATYRECAMKAPAEQGDKDTAVAQIDRIIERVRAREVSFWEYAMATADIDPLVSDEVLTADEWPRFAAEVRSAEIVLVGVPVQDVPSRGPSGGPPKATAPGKQ